jgi:hypothetical protein
MPWVVEATYGASYQKPYWRKLHTAPIHDTEEDAVIRANLYEEHCKELGVEADTRIRKV